jgi:hypothetical protein
VHLLTAARRERARVRGRLPAAGRGARAADPAGEGAALRSRRSGGCCTSGSRARSATSP